MPSTRDQLLERFRTAADAVADARPDVDRDFAREVYAEAAAMLHDGLVLDDLDDHDEAIVVTWLCEDLAAPDPGAALRARAETALDRTQGPDALHDPEAGWAACLTVVSLFGL